MGELFVPGAIDLGVQNVHLLSGEDIIGHTFMITDAETGLQTYRVEKPVMPSVGLDQQSGSYRVGLLPLRPYLDKIVGKVEFLSSHVMYLVPIPERMKTVYLQFVSEIIMAGPTLDSILQ